MRPSKQTGCKEKLALSGFILWGKNIKKQNHIMLRSCASLLTYMLTSGQGGDCWVYTSLWAINKQRGGTALRGHTPVTGGKVAGGAVFIKDTGPDSEAFKRPSGATSQRLPWEWRRKGVKVTNAISAWIMEPSSQVWHSCISHSVLPCSPTAPVSNSRFLRKNWFTTSRLTITLRLAGR